MARPLIAILLQLTVSFLILRFFHPALAYGGLFLTGVTLLIMALRKRLSLAPVRAWTGNATLALMAVAISVAFLEGSLHLFKPAFLQLDPQYSTTGDLADLTAREYLSPETFHKRPGTFRILGLGDSFAVCGRERGKNYHDFLAKRLQTPVRPKIEVINAGLPGVGPGYYWHFLKNYGDLFRPDLVLVGFFIGNDFIEAKFDTIQRGPFIQESRDDAGRWKSYQTFRNLWIYQFMARKAFLWNHEQHRQRDILSGRIAKEANFPQDAFLLLERRRMVFVENSYKATLQKNWEECARVLSAMHTWAEERRIPLVLAVFPDEYQVNERLRREVMRTYRMEERSIDLDFPNRLIRDSCTGANLRCLDLLEPFQAENRTVNLYLLNDTHWNDAGNQLAAELIATYLEQNHLIPRQGP